jgi:sarcosine oxidase, subunit delta
MLLIECPHCGARPEIEFRYGGEAHIARTEDPSKVSDEAWAEFLFYRTSPKTSQAGEGHAERWNHTHGCQRWFNAIRDTVHDKIITTYKMGTPKPRLSQAEDNLAGSVESKST